MNYDSELAFAKELAMEAGRVMRQYFLSEDLATEWKSDNTPLTIADTTINDMVIERVKAAYPNYAVIGEESSHDANGEYVWVVDPIDGTMPFSIGIPVSMFSLALVSTSDGQPVVGVAYDPQLDRLYAAQRSGGATLNELPITTSKQTGLENTYLSVMGSVLVPDKGFAYKSGHCADLARQAGAKPLNLYSQVYCATKVASGEFVGSIFGYGSPWDSAAVALIVEEAGGIVTDMEGKPRRYDQWGAGCILASSPQIHTQLLELVQASL
ncbi:MAG: Inositol-phosphate phosphatase [Candidatus Saccharibacteria bacterium]|nr:Inositol-phosphate phosphatase [Candidatus Saccharibacteria bacterium]